MIIKPLVRITKMNDATNKTILVFMQLTVTRDPNYKERRTTTSYINNFYFVLLKCPQISIWNSDST